MATGLHPLKDYPESYEGGNKVKYRSHDYQALPDAEQVRRSETFGNCCIYIHVCASRALLRKKTFINSVVMQPTANNLLGEVHIRDLASTVILESFLSKSLLIHKILLVR